MKVKDDVADRNASQLEPIRVARLHVELRPIVEAINQRIARMGQQAATQRQFISDAAHQLRTPLALLVAQIQFARQREKSGCAAQRSTGRHAQKQPQADHLDQQTVAAR